MGPCRLKHNGFRVGCITAEPDGERGVRTVERHPFYRQLVGVIGYRFTVQALSGNVRTQIAPHLLGLGVADVIEIGLVQKDGVDQVPSAIETGLGRVERGVHPVLVGGHLDIGPRQCGERYRQRGEDQDKEH